MVWIEISDKTWEVYKKSWALLGVRTQATLIRMLELELEESSMDVINDAECDLISDEPEALMRREMGIMKEKLAKRLMSLGFCQKEAEKLAERFRRLGFSDRNDSK